MFLLPGARRHNMLTDVDAHRQADLEEQIRNALQDESVPKIYLNGFVNSLGAGDVMVVLLRARQPVAVLNMSYTVAKTLAQKLGTMIVELENQSGNVIMSTDDVNEVMSRARGRDEDPDNR